MALKRPFIKAVDAPFACGELKREKTILITILTSINFYIKVKVLHEYPGEKI